MAQQPAGQDSGALIAVVSAALAALATQGVNALNSWRTSRVTVRRDELAMLRDELARTYDRIKELEARIDRLEHQENDYLKEIERLRREKLDITERYGRFVREYSEAGVRLRVLRDRILQLEMVMKANELAVPPPRREEDQEYLAPASHPETPARGD